MSKTMFNSTNFVLLSVLIGLFIDRFFDAVGILNGDEGVEYYAEVHQSKFNSWVHTFFMLFTVFGFSVAVPGLFCLSKKWRNIMQLSVWTFYFTHYATINLPMAIMTGVWYSIPMCLAYQRVRNVSDSCKGSFKLVWTGLLTSTLALLVQESLGHYMGGDDPSRPEGVWNAIMYAMYFSVSHVAECAIGVLVLVCCLPVFVFVLKRLGFNTYEVVEFGKDEPVDYSDRDLVSG